MVCCCPLAYQAAIGHYSQAAYSGLSTVDEVAPPCRILSNLVSNCLWLTIFTPGNAYPR